MKIMKRILCLGILSVGFVHGYAQQDSTGLPGDNFNLEGALEMFKNADSPEDFEQAINTENNKVNNLDLNGDGDIDYVKVIDQRDGDTHAFILRADVSENESQDVAVIELEKTGNDEAVVQIVGDEDLYGDEVIIEPRDEVQQQQNRTNVVVNVWTWPSVRYIYRPGYVVWASPWGWRARPVWWHPWRPVRWHVFHPYRAQYRQRYVVVHQHRVVRARTIYRPVRTTSVIVHNRHDHVVREHRGSRSENTSRSRGNTVTRKTTTTRGRNGKVQSTKRTTRVRKGH